MNGAERDQLLLGLCADVEIMRSILGVLCIWILPDDAIDRLIDELDVPDFRKEIPVKITNAAADRMASKLSELRHRKKGR